MSSRNSQPQDSKTADFGFLQQKIKTRFEVVSKIGSGAYGHVWKVRCKKTGETLAVKKVFLAFQNQTDAQRIYRQISLLSKINHQSVVRLKQVILSEGAKDIYIVLEYLESDVFRAIKNRVLDQMHKKYIVYQLASALNYLHSAGVLHRDLKPSNILINSACKIKICDFGLSRTLASQFFNKPIMTEFIATRWYRAPQVLLGSKSYSTKSDMWSLGCLIYELYSRRTLLPGQNTIDQITKIIEFKGKPTKQQIQSLNAAKAVEVLAFFEIQRKPIQYYYSDLQCDDIKQILCHLFHYNPQDRWSAKQLMESSFLSQFRDPSSERTAEAAIYLNLNDNRKYKMQRYHEEIAIIGNKGKHKFMPGCTKRLHLTYRNSNYFSLHASASNLQPKLNTTLRGKAKQNKHQSQTVSPFNYKSAYKDGLSSIYGSARGSFLLKGKQKSSHKIIDQNTLSKKPSQKYIHSKYYYAILKGRQSHSQTKIIAKLKGQGKGLAINKQTNKQINKQNYENKIRVLKKQKLKGYRPEAQKR